MNGPIDCGGMGKLDKWNPFYMYVLTDERTDENGTYQTSQWVVVKRGLPVRINVTT